MAKRSTKPAHEKPRAFLLGTMTLSLISETLAEVERLEAEKRNTAVSSTESAETSRDTQGKSAE
ncbi:hypothetical protein [Bordetella avium]|uniref:hypothetical protein n=1 Tax=Bordetella avium TaxID=521 RepID=UPI000E6A7FE5|nr:hypothetical protein [Bordetella avium]RIQ55244.1 hypothetical protein D0841_16960 [Bordetella avium]